MIIDGGTVIIEYGIDGKCMYFSENFDFVYREDYNQHVEGTSK